MDEEKQEEIDWVEAGITILEDFFQDYDYKRFRPFFHGTSNVHAVGIQKRGLCPREDKIPTVWRPKIASPTDRVFFARCGDNLPRSASSNAKLQMKWLLEKVKSKRIDPIEKAEAIETLEAIIDEPTENLQIEEVERVYFKLKNFNNYRRKVVRDTDENFLYEINNSFYNFTDTSNNKHASFICTPRIEKPVIDVLDVVWAKAGLEGVREVAKHGIPDVIKGLYTLGQSIAIKNGCVLPEDLELISEEEWYNQQQECSNLSIDGGCDKEEFAIKKQIAQGVERQWSYGQTDEGNKRKIEQYQKELEALPCDYSTGKRLSEKNVEDLKRYYTNRIKWATELFPKGKQQVAEGVTALKQLIEEKKVPNFLKNLEKMNLNTKE